MIPRYKMIYKLIVIIIELEMNIGFNILNYKLTVMIQYFNKSSELGPLKQIPILKQAIKIIRITYPHNAIQRINPAISRAQNLQQINLSHNKIILIDPIFQLRKLRIVNLSHNQISNISKGVLKLKKLQKIDLSFNLLTTLNNVNSVIELFYLRKGNLQFLLEGNEVLQSHQFQIQQKINAYREQMRRIKQKIENKKQLKQLEISKSLKKIKNNDHQNHAELSITQQQELNSGSHQIVGSLAESKTHLQQIQISINQYQRKLQVIAGSQFKGWSQVLLNIFKKQNQSAKSLLQVYRNIVKQLTIDFVNHLNATSKVQNLFIQVSQIQQIIKDYHFNLLQNLSQSHDIPMTNYKVWVQIYRQIRTMSQRIRFQTCNIIQCQIRNQQIEALKLFSPSKNDKSLVQNDQLYGMLFSTQKQFEHEKVVECNQCFIKNEQVKQLKQIVDFLSKQNTQIKQRNTIINQQNQKLTKQNNILNNNLQRRQKQIIQQLNQQMDASVYQKVFLSQAKGIQDLIKCEKHLKKNFNKKFEKTQKLNELFQTATALIENRQTRDQNQIVSQFYSHDREHQAQDGAVIIKRPYFNKNQEMMDENSKKIKKNSTHGSTQKKKKSINQKGLKSQKDRSNSKYRNSINKTNLLQRRTTERQVSQSSNNKNGRKINEISKNNVLNNSQIIISDFAVTETGKENKQNKQPKQFKKNSQIQSAISRKILSQLIIKKTGENKINEKIQLKDKQQTIKNMNDVSHEKENFRYVPAQYYSINLKNQSNYDRYLKHRLRNSIMQTLQKQGKRHSLSKEKLCSGKKQQKIKFFNTNRDKNANKNNQSSHDKLNGYPNSERQTKKQTKVYNYQPNNKSHTTIFKNFRI